MRGFVDRDIRGHEHRVCEEAERRAFHILPALSLNCVMRSSLPICAMEDKPVELRVGGDGGLHEQG